MKNQNYEIIILVISSRSEIYDNLINVYWKNLISYIKKHNHKIKVCMIYGKDITTDDLNIDNDDKLILNTSESYIPGILLKTLSAFKYIEDNYEYKHIFRTNLSSFLIIENLIKVSENLDNENVYAGVVGNTNNCQFVSGAGFWLSKDNILYILTNINSIDKSLIDDVSIGKILGEKKKILLKRYDITNDINVIDKEKLLNNIILDGHYHIRIKNVKNRNLDVDYMKSFTKILYIL
jgi:hypothetical protein